MNLIKSTGTFSFFTIISRLLGYMRDILIAVFLGAGPLADAFFVAFRIPNTFRRLFSEGTFNAAFVPSYSSINNKKKSENFANNIFSLLILGLLSLVFFIICLAFQGITNFKLDASSDALVLEGDAALKKYRENEEEFGDSSFLIVTYEPNSELFSKKSLSNLQEIENKLSDIDGVDSVLSLLDAPIFFQPKVSLTEVWDNLKDLTTEGINLKLAKDEIINKPIYYIWRIICI